MTISKREAIDIMNQSYVHGDDVSMDADDHDDLQEYIEHSFPYEELKKVQDELKQVKDALDALLHPKNLLMELVKFIRQATPEDIGNAVKDVLMDVEGDSFTDGYNKGYYDGAENPNWDDEDWDDEDDDDYPDVTAGAEFVAAENEMWAYVREVAEDQAEPTSPPQRADSTESQDAS